MLGLFVAIPLSSFDKRLFSFPTETRKLHEADGERGERTDECGKGSGGSGEAPVPLPLAPFLFRTAGHAEGSEMDGGTAIRLVGVVSRFENQEEGVHGGNDRGGDDTSREGICARRVSAYGEYACAE